MSAANQSPPTPDPIDKVLQRLDQVIAASIAVPSRIGYFASLYKRVTQRIQTGISQGEFEDGPRMQSLDFAFASRYFSALDQFQRNDPMLSPSWSIALNAATSPEPIIIQHLLLAMNPHINIDLAVAAAQICPGPALADLQADFMKINTVLAAIVPQVEQELGALSPLLYLLEEVGGHFDSSIINFDLDTAREAAWTFANVLAPLNPAAQVAAISQYERVISDLSQQILKPGPPFSWIVNLVSAKESRDIVQIIGTLNS